MKGISHEILGARVLSDKEIKMILPNYTQMIEEIADIRSYEKKKNSAKKVHNIFSIFGERGTGKSSVLYTVQSKLEGAQNNIVFDMIEPEMLSERGSILGCILSLLDDKMNELFSKIKDRKKQNNLPESIKKKFFEQCNFKEKNPLSIKMTELMEYYLFLEQEYRQVLIQTYTDLNTYVKKSSHVLSADIKFEEKFNDFIEQFIDVVNEMEGSKEETPLLFFFFDDIDLCPEKTDELLQIMNRYMRHPNIVCFLSGDKSQIENELRWALYRREQGNHIESWQDKESKLYYDSKTVLARKYFEKVMPNPMRYYLNKWNNEKKPFFLCEFANEKVTLGELLSKESVEKEWNNFFSYKKTDREEKSYFKEAFSMFSEQARGLSYVFYNFYLLNESLEESSDCLMGHRKQTVLETIWEQIQEKIQEQIMDGKQKNGMEQIQKRMQRETLSEYISFFDDKNNVQLHMHEEKILKLLKLVEYEYEAWLPSFTIENDEIKGVIMPLFFFFLLACRFSQENQELEDKIKRIFYQLLINTFFQGELEWDIELKKPYALDLFINSKLFFGISFLKELKNREKKAEKKLEVKEFLDCFYDTAILYKNSKQKLDVIMGIQEKNALFDKIIEVNQDSDFSKAGTKKIVRDKFLTPDADSKEKTMNTYLYETWSIYYEEQFELVSKTNILYGELNEVVLKNLIQNSMGSEMQGEFTSHNILESALKEEKLEECIKYLKEYCEIYQKEVLRQMTLILENQYNLKYDIAQSTFESFALEFYSVAKQEEREFLFGTNCKTYILVREYLDLVMDYRKIEELGVWVSET